MDASPKEITEKVFGLISDMAESHLEKLVSAWDSGTIVTKYNISEITSVSGQNAHRLMKLVADPNIDQKILHATMVTGLEAKRLFSRNDNRIEIVWTGPRSISAGIRSTKPVIEEMLRSTQPGEKVIIIGYRITSNAKSIINDLNSCLSKGIDIDIIVDKSKNNKHEMQKCFSEKGLTRPRIYTRKDKESQYYKVHAKVIIIHDRQMLVSSANLTELGTEVNFEIGLLVSGPIVKKMIALVTKMIDDEYFSEMS